MQALWYQRLLALVVLICCWLIVGACSPLFAQMTATITSLADDADAVPWDDPNTPGDETMDGVCDDLAHRCTLRAALLEAANMGVACRVTINLSGNLTLTQGTLYPTAGSVLQGNLQTTIRGSDPFMVLLELDSMTTVHGLKFTHGFAAIEVTGNGNSIAGIVIDSMMDGIDVYGNGNTVGGNSSTDRNIFTRMSQNGITLSGDNNDVTGNFIGIKTQGDTSGNEFGVFVSGGTNVIGGMNPGERNIISGNHVAGVAVSTLAGAGVATVIGNYIGTDSTGILKRPNGYGIQVLSGSALIGGGSAAEMNVISGNSYGGIQSADENLGVTILGNHIGVDPTGTIAVGNNEGIILAPGSFDALIENNLISRNEAYGVEIRGLIGIPSANHRIRGNEITHNVADGILIAGNAHDIIIGSSLTQDFPENRIQFNGGAGVAIHQTPSEIPRANTIRKNDFVENQYKGIDIGGSVQDLIQPPTIQNYVDLGNGAATVTVTHHRVGSIIDVYAAEQGTASTYQGRRWLGSGTVVDSGVAFAFPIDACGCTHLVATATDPAKNTSAFTTNGFLVGVQGERASIPLTFAMADAFPNPFNPSTTIRYELPHASQVSLKVYNTLGQEVATLVNETKAAGVHTVEFSAEGGSASGGDARSLASGVYFYRLQAGNFVETKKLVLLR